MRIEKLVKEEGVKVNWIHFPLHPDTPAEGQTLEALFAGRGKDIPAMQQAMKERMVAEGLPYGQRTHTYNSRLTQEVGKWADTQEGGEAFHDAAFRAYFVDAKNVGDKQVIVDIATAVGLDEDSVRRVLDERTFKDAVDEDWARSRQVGVTGVPTFAVGNTGVAGAQPYEVLQSLVRQGSGQ